MKLNIFLLIVICIGIASAINPKKINERGEFQPYYGYSVIAKIDSRWTNVARKIEYLIRGSNYNRAYKALPATTYHMSLYTIYSVGNKMIPPVERWVDKTGKKISKKNWLPDEVLEKQNNEALCVVSRFLYNPLNIKYAKLKVNDNTISLQLELQEESVQRIRYARKELARIYEHPNKSLEPVKDKLHITLAYSYKKKGTADKRAQHQIEELVRYFNGAKLSIPSVYLYSSMTQYNPYRPRRNIDCRVYKFWH